MAYHLSSHRFLVLLTVLDVGPSSETGLKSCQNLIGYPVTFHATVVPVGISCQASYCSSEGSWLSEIDDYFSPLVVCLAPSSPIRAS